jgi:hypothetical protein
LFDRSIKANWNGHGLGCGQIQGILAAIKMNFYGAAVTQNTFRKTFSNKPLERILYLKNNQHITLLKVVENLMMLYVGMVVYAGFYSDSFL